jgi:hypothetical protein
MLLLCEASSPPFFLELTMPLERRDVEAALERKGFVCTEGDHNFYTYHTLEGQKTSVWTKTSHGTKSKTLTDGLVSSMAKQCGLTNSAFKNLVACRLSREELECILAAANRITLKGPKPD